jgi:hypothetical protein
MESHKIRSEILYCPLPRLASPRIIRLIRARHTLSLQLAQANQRAQPHGRRPDLSERVALSERFGIQRFGFITSLWFVSETKMI